MAIPFNRIAPPSDGYRPDPRRGSPIDGDRRPRQTRPRETTRSLNALADDGEASAERDAAQTPGAPSRTRMAEFRAQELHILRQLPAGRSTRRRRGPEDREAAAEGRPSNLSKTRKKGKSSSSTRRTKGEQAAAQPAPFQAVGASSGTRTVEVRDLKGHMRRLLAAGANNAVGAGVTFKVGRDGHAMHHGADGDGQVLIEVAALQPVSAPEALQQLGQLDASGHAVAGSYADTLQQLAASEGRYGPGRRFFSIVYPEYDPASFAKGEDPSAALRTRLAQGDFGVLPDVLFVRAGDPGFDLNGRNGVYFSGDADNADERLHHPLLVLNGSAPRHVQTTCVQQRAGHALEPWFVPGGNEDSAEDEGGARGRSPTRTDGVRVKNGSCRRWGPPPRW